MCWQWGCTQIIGALVVLVAACPCSSSDLLSHHSRVVQLPLTTLPHSQYLHASLSHFGPLTISWPHRRREFMLKSAKFAAVCYAPPGVDGPPSSSSSTSSSSSSSVSYGAMGGGGSGAQGHTAGTTNPSSSSSSFSVGRGGAINGGNNSTAGGGGNPDNGGGGGGGSDSLVYAVGSLVKVEGRTQEVTCEWSDQ